MPIVFNGNSMDAMEWNGNTVDVVYFNGNKVYESGPPAGTPALSMSYQQTKFNSVSSGTTNTLSNMSFGTAASDRYVLFTLYNFSANSSYMQVPVAGVTVGGVSATSLVYMNTGSNELGVYYAAVPSGASGDIVVTYSEAIFIAQCEISTFRVTDWFYSEEAVDSSTYSSYGAEADFTLSSYNEGTSIGIVYASDYSDFSYTTTNYNVVQPNSGFDGFQTAITAHLYTNTSGSTITGTHNLTPEPANVNFNRVTATIR